jgi:hypothetical protein
MKKASRKSADELRRSISVQILGLWFVASTHSESLKPRTSSSSTRKSRRHSQMIAPSTKRSEDCFETVRHPGPSSAFNTGATRAARRLIEIHDHHHLRRRRHERPRPSCPAKSSPPSAVQRPGGADRAAALRDRGGPAAPAPGLGFRQRVLRASPYPSGHVDTKWARCCKVTAWPRDHQRASKRCRHLPSPSPRGSGPSRRLNRSAICRLSGTASPRGRARFRCPSRT